MERIGANLQKGLEWVLVTLMALMVADVTWQVASRFILRAPSSFTEELAGFLLIWIGLLGSAYGFRTRAHLGIDLLVARLEGGWNRGAEILAHGLVFLFALSTMVTGGLWLVHLAFRLDQISAAMGIRMGFVYLALPISGALIAFFSLESILVGGPCQGGTGPIASPSEPEGGALDPGGTDSASEARN
jgi:TRAP-type C4-dicarboxylate transport system permease small subunit